ncbi:hypothetical protein [Paraflavitalea pollutisoli]|uniref:hypothetical protein n=1 Tax=Paraflavitalea pollutisoli TaxID=3034143 RepID=UPI0023EC7B24|nr:hypothetical protein [Paraflavitalea sp. H1-2-19X]
MERLNYFNPYQSKEGYHEDQLTRAHLVVLKHSFHAFSIFVDYCKSKLTLDLSKEEKSFALCELVEHGWQIETQKSNPVIESDWLASVLITDLPIKTTVSGLAVSDRYARYDGLITFGDQLTFIIENKPNSANVWFGQVEPSREGLSSETKVYQNPIILEWKEIVRQLSHLLKLPSVAGYEKMMIEDFLAFIDHRFPFLNPYDAFHLCKGNQQLIYRRIQNLLKSIVINEDSVKYHYGWGFYIETPYPEIRQIGLIYGVKENEWWLDLSLFFGDTQTQAKAFYAASPKVDHLSEDWEVSANFHVAFRSSNLVWFEDVPDPKKYVSFWTENSHEIYQQKKETVREYFDWLKEEGVIIVGAEDERKLQDKFYRTAMQALNICPGFGAIYTVTGKEAEEFDSKNELGNLLLRSIGEGLRIIGKDGREFLRMSN